MREESGLWLILLIFFVTSLVMAGLYFAVDSALGDFLTENLLIVLLLNVLFNLFVLFLLVLFFMLIFNAVFSGKSCEERRHGQPPFQDGVPPDQASWSSPGVASSPRSRFSAVFRDSLVAVIVLLFIANLGLAGWARYLTSADHDEIGAPVSARVLVIRRQKTNHAHWMLREKKLVSCHAFCLYALLSGKVDRVLVMETEELDETPDIREKAVAFSIERMDTCPDVALHAYTRWLEISRGGRERGYMPSVTEAMKVRMITGECLVARSATLEEADVLITIRERREYGPNARLKWLFYDRVIVHLRDGSKDDVTEMFRWTGVRYYLFPLLFSAPKDLNYEGKYENINLVVKDVLERLLGMDFVLDSRAYEANILGRIDAVLKTERSPTKLEWEVFSGYFNFLKWKSDKTAEANARKLNLALRLLKSPLFPPLPDLDHIIELARHSSSWEGDKEMVRLLLKKMDDYPSWHEIESRTAYMFSIVIRALDKLPEDALRANADLLLKVLGRKEIRLYASHLFFKAGFLGERLLPLLQKTLDEAARHRRERLFWDSSRLNVAALKGLCAIGEKGKPMAARLLAMMKTGELSLTSLRSDGDEVTLGHGLGATLLRMGVKPEEIERHFPADAREDGRRYLESVLRDWRKGNKGVSLCEKYL